MSWPRNGETVGRDDKYIAMEIADEIAKEFRCFGGGYKSGAPMFAEGVNVEDVVLSVIRKYKTLSDETESSS